MAKTKARLQLSITAFINHEMVDARVNLSIAKAGLLLFAQDRHNLNSEAQARASELAELCQKAQSPLLIAKLLQFLTIKITPSEATHLAWEVDFGEVANRIKGLRQTLEQEGNDLHEKVQELREARKTHGHCKTKDQEKAACRAAIVFLNVRAILKSVRRMHKRAARLDRVLKGKHLR